MSKVNESVLVVEDDAELREALVDTLRAAGLSALSAPDAPAALQLLESEEIALVISDVQMPGPNGYQLLSSIKQRRPDLPVVLMTAYGTVAQAVAAMREGATDYIIKPFDAQALIEMAQRQLALRVVPNELVAVDSGSKRLVSMCSTRLSASSCPSMAPTVRSPSSIGRAGPTSRSCVPRWARSRPRWPRARSSARR